MNDQSAWTRTVIVALLSVMGLGTLVLGAVGVVAVASADRSGLGGSDRSAVEVHLSEFAIAMTPSSVAPGDVVFNITNHGTVEHNFAIPSLNIRTANLKPGESTSITVEGLTEGNLGVICEVAGHESAGMQANLVVSASAVPKLPVEASGNSSMSWQQMDSMMEAAAKEFPAKTSGTGNSELGYVVSQDGYKVFDLTAKVISWEVEPGKFVDGWSYNGQIPGPVIRVNTGDKVRIRLKNELPESTSLHLHGIRVPNTADGVDPYTQPPIKPGETYVYEFVAREPSVGMYHSHHNAQAQVPNGLAGALLIDDWKTIAMDVARTRVADSDGDAESEVVMVLNDSGNIGLSLNGKSFPATQPYTLKVGESMVVHYFNEGSMTHPMHLHQPSGLVVAHDGKVLESPFWADTLNVAPGERWTVVYTAVDKGVWAWHCHILTHAETPEGMRYMVTALIVS